MNDTKSLHACKGVESNLLSNDPRITSATVHATGNLLSCRDHFIVEERQKFLFFPNKERLLAYLQRNAAWSFTSVANAQRKSSKMCIEVKQRSLVLNCTTVVATRLARCELTLKQVYTGCIHPHPEPANFHSTGRHFPSETSTLYYILCPCFWS